MRSVSVKYHVVENATADMPFPADDLRALYWSAGIDLALDAGEPLDADPALGLFTNYAALLAAYRRSPLAGHLIVGLTPPSDRYGISGELVDLDTRGLAAVYVQSGYIQREGRSALLQTCAHELGHMLNLSHGDVSTLFVSVMDSAPRRQDVSPQSAWEQAMRESDAKKARGELAYLEPPLRTLPCFPFSYGARERLNSIPEDSLLPWRSKFQDTFDGSDDGYERGSDA